MTNAQAKVLGLSRYEVESKAWRAVFRGVHVTSDTPLDLATRCRAALVLHPADAHLSHATAAELIGVPIGRGRGARHRPSAA